jgi:hypothetical protein
MSNITLAVDDQLLERVRVLASQRGTTVNAIVREHFEKLTRDQDRLAQAKRELLALSENIDVDLGLNYRFNREETYAERDFPRHQHSDLRGGRGEK